MTVGPFFLVLSRLFLLLGIGAALLTAHLVERRSGSRVETPLWWSLLAGLVVARAAYVLTHLADFRTAPWQALYFWQDGYLPAAGVLALLVVAAVFAVRRSIPARRLLPPLLIGLMVWGGLHGVTSALRKGVDKPLPELAVEDLDGRQLSLADFRGQPVVVNLWATWCPPCRREMPVLSAAQRSHPEVHFVFLNQLEGAETIRRYLSAERLMLANVLRDPAGRIALEFDAAGLPTTLFFDADGRLRDTHVGELSRARLGDYLNALRAR